ncbi:hypothetical protein KKG45_06230, partial [bacterium]|nr:hypothetical protein [bacterium]
MRRRDRPGPAQALRGRTRFYMGAGGEALPDLLESRRALAAGGRVDPVTSTVIGTVYMNQDRAAIALDYLGEAVAADPELAVAWRTFGVALAKVNRHAEADTAMDRAVELDPYAASGWYNRGLHHINRKRFEPAREDLLVAAGFAPDNPQIGQLIGHLERDWELADDPDLLAAAEARADSVRADLASGEWLARNVAG